MVDESAGRRTTLAGLDGNPDSKLPGTLADWVLIAILAAASLLYFSIFDSRRFGAYHDDGIYVATAKSMAEGGGYRIISLPYEPAQTKYPPLYPILLSLIWKAYPHFPQNIPAMMIMSIIATLSSLLIVWRYLLRMEYATRWQALGVVAMTALNWRTMILATSVYSEMVYAALSVSALFLAEKHDRRERSSWRTGSLLGVFMGLTFLTRSTGIALVIAVAGYFALRKKWRRAVLPVGVASLFVVGWVVWCSVNRTTAEGLNVPYYTSYLGHLNQIVAGMQQQSGSSKFDIFLNVAIENLIGGVLIAVPLVCSGFGYNSFANFSGFSIGLSVCVLAFILFLIFTGFIRTASKRIRLVHIYVVVCLGMQLFWLPDISHDRFLMPLFPFLAFFLIGEVSHLATISRNGLSATGPARKLSGALVALIPVGVIGATLFGYGSGIQSSLLSLRASAARAAEDEQAIAWIRGHTDRSEVIACYRDPAYFLFTGNKAVRSLPMVEGYSWDGDQPSIDKLYQGVSRVLDEGGAKYLVVTSTDFELEDRPQLHQKSFDKMIEQHPGNLVLVFESTEGKGRIYRIERSAP